MPIYEFYCNRCHAVYQFFSARVNTDKRPACPHCGKKKLERVMSAFAVTGSASGDYDNGEDFSLDDAKMEAAMMALAGEADKLDEDNPRQAAQLMRKLTEAGGLKLGRNMEEALSRMEQGEDPDRIEEEMGEALDSEDPFMPGKAADGKGANRHKQSPRRDETIYDL